MATDATPSSPVVRIKPGKALTIFEGGPTAAPPGSTGLAVIASQRESLDDGGSQSGLAIMRIRTNPPVRIEFDVRDGVVVGIPGSAFSVAVRNLNEAGGPSLKASAFYVSSALASQNTRTFDIGYSMEQPNIRVPRFASAFTFDHGRPDLPDYAALLSDSATGETYGLARPYVRYPLNHRTRFVRFMNLPESTMGTLTFFLSI